MPRISWTTFERMARDYETDLVPGRFFQAPAHFRLGFGGRPEMLAEGLRQLGRALASQTGV